MNSLKRPAIILLVLMSCSVEDDQLPIEKIPEVMTLNASQSDGDVKLKASVILHDASVSGAGFEYSEDPELLKEKITLSVGNIANQTSFEYLLSNGLTKNTVYHYRAFVIGDTVIYGNTMSFTFDGYIPEIGSISSDSGQIADTISIFGKHFYSQNNPTYITFSEYSSTIVTINDSLIQCIVPAGINSTNLDIKVRVANSESNSLEFILDAPVIRSFTPGFGFDENEVELMCANLSKEPSLNKFYVQNIEAELLSVRNNEAIIKIPQMEFYGPTTIDLKIGPQRVSSTDKYDLKGPVISSFSPTESHSGEIAIIEGNYFTSNGDITEVYFGEHLAEVIELREESIQVIVPAPIGNLLTDNSLEITVKNGLKSITSSESFSILNSWEEKTPTPFKWYWRYNAFSYEGKGYILELNDLSLYEYDPIANSWKTGTTFPGTRDDNSQYVVFGSKVYKMGGIRINDPINELWEYDLITGTWTQKDDMPFSFRAATHFIHNDEIFVITNTGQVWSYNALTDVFNSKNNIPTTFDRFAFAYSIDNEILLVTYGSTWIYDDLTDTWRQHSINPFNKSSFRNYAIGFFSNGNAYIIEDGTDLYRFNADQSSWSRISFFPGCRGDNSYKTVFVIGNDAYVAATSSNYGGCSPLLYKYRD